MKRKPPDPLVIGAGTDRGKQREVNEDSYAVHPNLEPRVIRTKGELFIVADGVGGNTAGDRASKMACQIIMSTFYGDPDTDIIASLARAIQVANQQIYEEARRNHAYQGMCTTVVAAVVHRNQLIVAHVGDSRAYLLRGKILRQLTRDHSWVEEALAAHEVTPQEAANHPMRNLITRAVGNNPTVQPDVQAFPLQPGDLVLLATDGLTNEVSSRQIAQILSENMPQDAVRKLIAQANAAGGSDNITGLVIGIPPLRVKEAAVRRLVPVLAGSVLVGLVAVGVAYLLMKPPLSPALLGDQTATPAASQPPAQPSTVVPAGSGPVIALPPTSTTAPNGAAPTAPPAATKPSPTPSPSATPTPGTATATPSGTPALPGKPTAQAPCGMQAFVLGQTISFRWSEAANCYPTSCWYEIEVEGGPTTEVKQGTSWSWTPTVAKPYRWHVRAKTAHGLGEWSDWCAFTVVPPTFTPTPTSTSTPTGTPTPTGTATPTPTPTPKPLPPADPPAPTPTGSAGAFAAGGASRANAAAHSGLGGNSAPALAAGARPRASRAGADLAISKSAGLESVRVGQILTYTLVVTNGGPETATNLVLTDTLPAGVSYEAAQPGAWTCGDGQGLVTCTLDSLAPSEEARLQVGVRVNGSGILTNTATVTAAETDPDMSNNVAVVTTTAVSHFLFAPAVGKEKKVDSGDDADEPNNFKEEATSLAGLSKPKQAQICCPLDYRDVYSMTVRKGDFVEVELQFRATESAKRPLSLELFGPKSLSPSGAPVARGSPSEGVVHLSHMASEPGVYYLDVAPTPMVSLPFTYTLWVWFGEDPYEPNDTRASAWGPISPDVDYHAFIWSAADPSDYFRFHIAGRTSVTVTLTGMAPGVDYDLYLYDSAGSQPIASSDRWGSADERIENKSLESGDYYIRIYPYSGYSDTKPYILRYTRKP